MKDNTTQMNELHHTQYSHDSQTWPHSHDEGSAGGHPSASSAHPQHSGIKAGLSHDDVARKAYALYEKEGCPQGRATQHWLAAELQLSA